MSIQDPIANLFSSINNAQGRNKETVKVPSSTKKLALLSMLKQEDIFTLILLLKEQNQK